MMKRMATVFAALMLCLCCALAQAETGSWLKSVLGDELAQKITISTQDKQESGYIALVYIEGEIIEGAAGYDHVGTLNAVGDLIGDSKNAALLLYLNTPGGALYEADELYHAIDTYKRETGRPVYAYMAQECCSAGVYIAMTADRIAASRMTVTGSVGVYMSTYSPDGLLEKLGIDSEYIASGENKVPGSPTLTDEQRAIYQAIVDEGFDFFTGAVAASRALTPEQMEGFLDGRLLTALQAKEMGLIDDVLYYDEFTDAICKLHDGAQIVDKTPEEEYGLDAELLNWLMDLAPGFMGGQSGMAAPEKRGGLMS